MKKTLLAVTLVTAPLAALADGGVGCGWGSMLFEGESGVGPNVLAATTNGTFGNQTFGISSGTAGCDSNPTVSLAAVDFLDNNMEKVAKDMATGQGESLDTFANLMGIADKDKDEFFNLTHANFSTIFNSASVNSNEVIAAVREVMLQDSALAKYVS